jgi:predicted enzyme related to lactoylglutathione lyase
MAIVASHPPGAFCWVELATPDHAASKAFYGKLFGWEANDMDMGPNGVYTIFKLKGEDVAAAYTLNAEQMPGVPPHWGLYMASADVDATARRCAELGGQVLMQPFDVFDAGRMAVMQDPTGATFSGWTPKQNAGIGIVNEHGAFCWGQVNTNNTGKAEAFYTQLFGWGAKTGGEGQDAYTEWELGGVPIGGMMSLPPGQPGPSHWLAYFAVDDCDAIATQAAALGAQICVPPTDIPGTGRFAVLSDPQGVFFAVYRGS